MSNLYDRKIAKNGSDDNRYIKFSNFNLKT